MDIIRRRRRRRRKAIGSKKVAFCRLKVVGWLRLRSRLLLLAAPAGAFVVG